MHHWIYEEEQLVQTPSRADGIELPKEERYRRDGVQFLIDIGRDLNLEFHPTLATAAVYFHRFYMHRSYKDFHRKPMSVACLFLAGKVEETPKKCRDILTLARKRLTDQEFYVFGKNPQEEITCLERILLKTLKFDLQVEHPYKYLVDYIKTLKADRTDEKANKETVEKILQMAWAFVNDSLLTALSLRWEPEILAVSFIYLATRMQQTQFVHWQGKTGRANERWWDGFIENLPIDQIDEICHDVLDHYGGTKTSKRQTEYCPVTPGQSSSSNSTPLSHPSPKSCGPQAPQTPTTSASGALPQFYSQGSNSKSLQLQSSSASTSALPFVQPPAPSTKRHKPLLPPPAMFSSSPPIPMFDSSRPPPTVRFRSEMGLHPEPVLQTTAPIAPFNKFESGVVYGQNSSIDANTAPTIPNGLNNSNIYHSKRDLPPSRI